MTDFAQKVAEMTLECLESIRTVLGPAQIIWSGMSRSTALLKNRQKSCPIVKNITSESFPVGIRVQTVDITPTQPDDAECSVDDS